MVVMEVNVNTATSSDNVSTVKSSPVASILYSPHADDRKIGAKFQQGIRAIDP